MKIVFASNYMNFHQAPFYRALQKIEGVECIFIECSNKTDGQKRLGYYKEDIEGVMDGKDIGAVRPFCLASDILIIGEAPVGLAKKRNRMGKLTFFYSERLFKGADKVKNTLRWVKYSLRHRLYKGNILLCASAYAYTDYLQTGNFHNRAYKWGYFPKTIRYDIDSLFQKKQNNLPIIFWAGRFLDLKHPEYAILVAERLKAEGYDFELRFAGGGQLQGQLEAMVREKQLSDQVCFLGTLHPDEVRDQMEQANIFLFTSDCNEGWGAVLSESMNSGCAVVASHAIGAVPFMIRDKENGLVYRSGNLESLYTQVKFLLDHPDIQRQMGTNAYRTIVEEWNAESAAERLCVLATCLMNGQDSPYQYGPCSKAERIKDDWY